ncbi:MAG: hypothetical protein PW845_01560 [Pseudomonas sp.]|uniref:hypothetical protein n=1 Tax=Pseudomonas abieticivorans TaxID=2931382 RepID=UPI0020BEEF3A|nr:hypothetical protein [Pseudomonas sp. PIA16]MDE1164080.1 hypothetical protein [Pseudomonas sp.]
MDSFYSMLLQVMASLALLTVGFNFRERDLGVFTLWVGMLSLLGLVLYQILLKLS